MTITPENKMTIFLNRLLVIPIGIPFYIAGALIGYAISVFRIGYDDGSLKQLEAKHG